MVATRQGAHHIVLHSKCRFKGDTQFTTRAERSLLKPRDSSFRSNYSSIAAANEVFVPSTLDLSRTAICNSFPCYSPKHEDLPL